MAGPTDSLGRDSSSTATAPLAEAAREKAASAGLARQHEQRGIAFQCLVVSRDAKRQTALKRAAFEGGWDVIDCDEPLAAHLILTKTVVQLGIIDLADCETRNSRMWGEVAERMAEIKGLLLVMCGSEGNSQQEIWARQLGTWVYLAGDLGGDGLALLCSEARQIAQQLCGVPVKMT